MYAERDFLIDRSQDEILYLRTEVREAMGVNLLVFVNEVLLQIHISKYLLPTELSRSSFVSEVYSNNNFLFEFENMCAEQHSRFVSWQLR